MPEDCSWWRLEHNQEINLKLVLSDICYYYMLVCLVFGCPILMSLLFWFYISYCCSLMLRLFFTFVFVVVVFFLIVQATFQVSFTEQRLPSGQPAIKLRLVESCSHGWPSGTFSHLHTGSLEISQSDHWVSHLELFPPNCSVCSDSQLWKESWLFQKQKKLSHLCAHKCLQILPLSSGRRSFDLTVWFLEILSVVRPYTGLRLSKSCLISWLTTAAMS